MMIDTALSISILSFIGIMLCFSGIFFYVTYLEKRKTIVEKIKGVEPSALEEAVDSFSNGEGGFRARLLKFVGALGRPITPRKQEDLYSMRKSLLQAGFRKHNTHIIFFGFKAFSAFLFLVLFMTGKVFLLKTIPSTHLMLLSIFFALIGFYLPNFWLRIKIEGRKEKILEGFPDALDLMVVCVEAGMGLDAAITRVGEEMRLKNKVLSDEFKQLSLELRAGKQRSDALRNLALRTGLDDVSSLITLLIQTDRFGTSVAQALRVHSDSMRTKRYQRAEEIAAKLPVKLVFPLVLFIMPALFVVIVGPAVIKIVRNLLPAFGQ